MNLKEMLGEATEYDKKQAVERSKVRNWLKSVSAFSNGIGGILVFGVSDNDEIIGLQDIKSDSEFVSQKIKERIDPTPQSILRIEQINGKNLLIVKILAGTETPYYYVGDGKMETYIRIGNESVVADATEQKRLVLRGKNSSYDSLVSEYKFNDYSFTKLKERFKSWSGKSYEDKMFHSFGLVVGDYLTNAGALLADESPVYHSRLFCTRWNGCDKSGGILDALDSSEYSGSLITLLNEGLGFVKRHNKLMWKKTANSRIELPDYVERSVFESLVNALIHRDYLIFGSEVHIDIFDNRIVIYSPGGMPNGDMIQNLNIERIPSTRRNPILADVFHRLGYMERQGSGLEKIISGYLHEANYSEEKKPIFFSDRTQFTVTLMNLNYLRSAELKDKTSVKLSDKSKKRMELVANYYKKGDKIYTKDVAGLLEISMPMARRLLANMVQANILETTGLNKNKAYILHNKEIDKSAE